MVTGHSGEQDRPPFVLNFIIISFLVSEILAFFIVRDLLDLEMVNPVYCKIIWGLNVVDILINIAILIYLLNRIKAAIPFLLFMAGFDLVTPFIVHFVELKTGWGFKIPAEMGNQLQGFADFLVAVLMNGFLIYYFTRKSVQRWFY